MTAITERTEASKAEKPHQREGLRDHYRPNPRDLRFNLDLFGNQELYTAMGIDREVADSFISTANRLATEQLAPSYTSSDRHPAVFNLHTHTVTLPSESGVRASFAAYQSSDLRLLGVPEAIGGIPCPPSLVLAVREPILGAHPAVYMYGAGPGFAGFLDEHGTSEQKNLAKIMVDEGWGATMVLTEPDAGSDVGAGRTKARKQKDGSYHIDGVKRFITSGEHDLTKNIGHFVLARVVDPDGNSTSGTRGLSLFFVPKYEVDPDTGKTDKAKRNGVYATGIEDKMGLKASSTCELTFGAKDPAKGSLIGQEGEGFALMLDIIRGARMMVGQKSAATLSTAHLQALEYAQTREQGADPARPGKKRKIIEYPQVRDSLLLQKAYAEGMRALVFYTASQQDAIALAESRGETDSKAVGLNELLLPIVKAYCARKTAELLSNEVLEIFGGSGYTQDVPIEQYIRDQKIDSVYEGTTNMQGLDFFGRKILKDNGVAISQLAMRIGEFSQSEAGGETLAQERQLLAQGLENVSGIMGKMIGWTGEAQTGDTNAADKIGQNTNRLLMATGDVVVSWLLLRQAEEAQSRLRELLSSGGESNKEEVLFYEGKIAAAKHFAKEVLPRLSAERQITDMTEVPSWNFGHSPSNPEGVLT